MHSDSFCAGQAVSIQLAFRSIAEKRWAERGEHVPRRDRTFPRFWGYRSLPRKSTFLPFSRDSWIPSTHAKQDESRLFVLVLTRDNFLPSSSFAFFLFRSCRISIYVQSSFDFNKEQRGRDKIEKRKVCEGVTTTTPQLGSADSLRV